MAKTPDERGRAARFIAESIEKWYQCSPMPLPAIVIIAEQRGAIVGTVSLCFGNDDVPFPLENIYSFDYGMIHFPFRRIEIVQCSRWIATVPEVAPCLLYASALAGLRAGCLYGLAEVKPKIAERLKEIGVELYPVPATVDHKSIPLAIRSYYEIPPPPFPIMVRLAQKRDLLRPRLADLLFRRDVVMDEFM